MTIIKKKKWMVTLFIMSILGIILSFSTYRRSIEEIEREGFAESVHDYTQMKLESIRNYISSLVYDLDTTAQMMAEYDSIWDPQVKEILAMANRMDEFVFTAVADTNGNGYNHLGEQFNIAEKECFQTALQGTVAFSEVQQSKEMKGKKIQIFACPMWSEDRQVVGVALGKVDLDYINKVIAPKNEETLGNIYIIDLYGNYISRFQTGTDDTKYINFWADLQELTSINKDIVEIKSDFAEKKEGNFTFLDHGERRYGCYMPIGTRNWQLVYTVKDTILDQKLHTIFYMDTKHMIYSGVCHLVLLLCVVMYFRNTTKEIKQAHQEASQNMEILRIALGHSKQFIFEYDKKRHELIQKTDFQDPLFQWTGQRITLEKFVEQNIVDSQSVASFMQLFDAIQTKQSVKADLQINRGSEQIWCRISLHNIHQDELIVGTVDFLEDITELKRMKSQVKQKLELQDALIAKALLYVIVDVGKNCVLEMNGEESKISYGNFLQQEVISHVPTEERDTVLKALSLHTLYEKFQQGTDTTETHFKMDFQGTMRWVSCMAYDISVQESKMILIISDIDEKKRQEIALQHQAERDGLTGLYNAMTARYKIEKALAAGYVSNEKQILILFDLDNYKQINDTFGHKFGDQVLLEVSQLLQKQFRSSDIVGRIGGDEFIILLRHICNYEDAEKLIKGLCEMVHKIYEKNGKKVVLSASVGVTKIPEQGYTFTELFQKSDLALYQVKKQSKDGYKYYDGLEEI